MKRTTYIFSILTLFATACSDHDLNDLGGADAGEVINVGGVATSPLDITVSENATRAKLVQDAEEVEWLRAPLKEGLDVTYGKVTDTQADRNERVAILRLLPDPAAPNDPAGYEKDPDTDWAIYTFRYKGTNPPEDAIWYGNGEHYFEGMFVPDNLRYGMGATGEGRENLESVNATYAPNIITDQSNASNYLCLEHYLAMPANTVIHATVGRVKLPFYHRLSRVIAYILIDPEMTSDPANPVTLKGYKRDAAGTPMSTENPTTTSLRFCNVGVLAGVKDNPPADATATHELTPRWDKPRKVIPHFEAEEGSMVQTVTGALEEKDENFYLFYDDKTQEYIFPTMKDWLTYYADYKNATDEQLKAAKVSRINYGRVPVYDLIVRPTYTSENAVMYDERNSNEAELSPAEQTALVGMKNKIDFELTLSNGLIYTKEFEFDLNANEQTVVYLRITRESVNYNATGSEIWIDKSQDDDWYGVDNKGEHSLSYAGSSWQRAYTYGKTVSDDKVTDGGFYNESTAGEDGTAGQYVRLDTWKKRFAQAYKGGECHGDYFILMDNITIDAKELPDNFVFTGHLDAHGHTISVTGTNEAWVEYVITDDYEISPIYSNQSGTEYSLPTLYTKIHHNANYTSAAELYEIEGKWYLKNTLSHTNEVWHPATEDDVNEGKAQNVGDKVIDTPERYDVVQGSVEKQDAYDEYVEASPSLKTVMAAADGTYYVYEDGAYKPFAKPSALYEKVEHVSGSALFAGLNGAYSVTREGEANVHTEGGVKVPYTDGTTGWRAEVLNLRVNGKLFADEVYAPNATLRSGYDVTKVSGNVDNCSDTKGRVPNHTPALFKY